MPFRPDQPYNTLPPLPPKGEIETKPVLKACIGARAALAELKGVGDLIPNQSVLINSIPLLEAQASSAIENIVTTTDRLFRFAGEGEGQADPATKEALRYRTALHEGYELLRSRPLATGTATQICRTIRGVEMDIRATPGTALVNDATGKVIYTPPEGVSRLRNMLSNWERYIHKKSDVDPLIVLAVMHYQFEAIHPFTDGNGPHWARAEPSVFGRERVAENPCALSQPAHHPAQSGLLPPSARCNVRCRMGVLDSLHAVRRKRDGAVDYGQDHSYSHPLGEYGGANPPRSAEIIFA
jgi:hypothetical protein